MPISGTVTVSGIVAPTSTGDTYPVTDPKYGLGGLRSITGGAGDALTDIPAARREEGMLVYVQSTSKYYKLVGGTADINWTEFVLLPVDVHGNVYITGNLIVSGYIETDTGIQGNPYDAPEYFHGIDLDGGSYS
jgi:hypothetical protein